MNQQNTLSAFLLGASIFLGLSALGYFISGAVISYKEYDRSVTVKGLSERELPADIVIWPIVFTEAGNDLSALYASIDGNTKKIKDFLVSKGIDATEVTASTPSITDNSRSNILIPPKPSFAIPPLKPSRSIQLKSI